jgi:hypothetical protein
LQPEGVCYECRVLTDYLMVRVSRFVHNRDKRLAQLAQVHTRQDYRSWLYKQRLDEGYKRGGQVSLVRRTLHVLFALAFSASLFFHSFELFLSSKAFSFPPVPVSFIKSWHRLSAHF